MNKKNIVFIITDDQTHDTINRLGNKDIITPNLDELTRNGTTFSNAHIPSGTSGAVCMPSRAMINTGKQPFNLCDAGETIPQDHNTLGEMLLKNGYNTFACGKWHNGVDGFKKSFNSGDNIFFGGMWDHYNVPVNKYDPSGEYDNTVDMVVNFFNSKEKLTWIANKFNPGVHSTELLTETAVEYLKKDHDKPFMLYLSYLAPHDPRVMPDKFRELYSDIQLPENYKEDHEFQFGQEFERDEQIAARPLTEEYVKNERMDYYAMISHLDNEIGKVVNEIKRNNLQDDTIIVFTSDNGLSIGMHGLMGKQNHYDESLRIPLIFSGPGIPKDKIVSDYVYLFDLLPTILDLVGVEYNELEIDGRSFEKAFRDTAYERRRNLYFAFTHYIRSVKDERYKLIVYRPKKGVQIKQLFDLKNDPAEKCNVIGQSSMLEVEKSLTKLLYDYKDTWERDENNLFTKKFWIEKA